MYKNFQEIIEAGRGRKRTRICVAAAEDAEILKALEETGRMGLTEGVLVGDKQKILQLLEANGIRAKFRILEVHSEDYSEDRSNDQSEEAAVRIAIECVKNGTADVLMKGMVNSSVFMKGVLNKETGLRTERAISHMACYEIPAYGKLLFCSDSGINVAPDLNRKKDILNNALKAIRKMGYESPKVALLAANELVDPKIAATRDAADLMKLFQEGAFGDCIMEGPIAFDVAFSQEAARHKGIESKVSGHVDLLLCPNIEVGNALGKSWLHFNQAKWAGLVLGATKTILMGSRSDTFDVKVNGIALACLMNNREHP